LNRKLKNIFFLCSSTSWAGTEKWTLRAAEETARQSYNVTFVARKPEVFIKQNETELNYIKLPLRNDGDLFSVLKLSALLKKKKADVIVLTRVRDYWLGGLASRIAGVPALLRLGVVRELRQKHLMDYLRYGLLPSAILVNAQAIKETLIQTPWIKEEKVSVIYNGVNTPGPIDKNKAAEFRKQEDIKDGSLFVLGAGRLAVEKRWDWLIKASSEIMDLGFNLNVSIIGEGNERPRLEKLISESQHNHHFCLAGYKANSSEWLGSADLVVLPSSNEGVSNTMLEAMGMATPVIATASGGVREHFSDRDNILLANTNDYDGFKNRLLNAVQNENVRKTVGQNGYEYVKNEFRWDKMTKNLIHLFKTINSGL